MKEEFSWHYSLRFNTINLFGVIDTAAAERIVSQLQYVEHKFRKDNVPMDERVITMQINSPGGSVTDGLAIMDTMNSLSAKVATVGLGMVASMAAVILAAGAPGMRSATENCEVLIHQPLGGASGQASDIIIAAKHVEKTRSRRKLLLAKKTGQPVERIEKDTDRDTVMSAEEAKKYGLVDLVLCADQTEERL